MLAFFYKGNAQGCPPNLDFEAGNFSGWQCSTGYTDTVSGQNVITLSPSGPVAGRHEIISASSTPTFDKYGNFPTLCPYGGNYSVKLGNALNGQAEGLSYTFTVPANVDTFTFTYYYAVVLQEPFHLKHYQSRFIVSAYDSATGQIINCASYDYILAGTIPGFKVSPVQSNVLYKEWTPASLQFSGLQNRTVRLEFKTADCVLGAHFGYAYIDVGGGCTNLLAAAPYCANANSVTLNAPYGYKNYIWYNENYSTVIGNSQSVILTPPPAIGTAFWVDLVPYPGYGCRDTAKAIVVPMPVPDRPVTNTNYNYCQNQIPPALTAIASPGHFLVWYINDTTGAGSITPPIPSTASPGQYTYYVSQKTQFGCESNRTAITVFVSLPPVNIATNAINQCLSNNQYIFTGTTTEIQNALYTWDFGDGQSQSSSADSVVTHSYSASGTYIVKLKLSNGGICSNEKVISVNVIPKPVASFTYPITICEKTDTVLLGNSSVVPGGVSSLTSWWWNIGGIFNFSQTPAAFIPTSGGALPVQLVVGTIEGCISDTQKITLAIRYQPVAAFTHSEFLCNNEIVQFTDASYLPATALPETIVKWSWQISASSTSIRNPSAVLPAGTHLVKLTAESNFGCKSKSADRTILIHSKPSILIGINDSCVFRPIKYNASSVASDATKWYWNFGSGFVYGPALITKTFTKEGNQTFSIIGETNAKCKDTLLRPFTIFDNKAFAGRDTIAATGEPVQLNANGGSNIQYTWSPSVGLNNPNIENPTATWNQTQLYKLYSKTDKGCESQSQVLIKRFKGPELYVPTAFTPNGDKLNDVLKVIPVGIKAFHYFGIYNRYGQRIFYTEDYLKGWDGTQKGSPLPTGTFVVIASATDYKGVPMFYKGTVVLIR